MRAVDAAVGGRVSLRVPWPILAIDPHRLEDATAAIFGEALFDTLYARDEAGAFSASLAEADPEPEGASLRVRLRTGLRTAKGRAFEARDAAAAIARSRTLGGRAWLADVPPPKVDGGSLVFAMRDASRLVRALASPIVAMVPIGFASDAPDGTGPMKFVVRGDAVVLARNPLAARGPSLSRRGRPSGRSRISRRRCVPSRAAPTTSAGWAPASTSRAPARAPSTSAPQGGRSSSPDATRHLGRARASRSGICDGIPPARLSYLALGPAWTTEPEQGWGGPPTSLHVRDDAPWLVELAKAIAATISRPSHEVTAKPVPRAEICAAAHVAQPHAALDVVRPVAPGSFAAMIALATADNALRASELVQHPPKLGEVPAAHDDPHDALRRGREIRVQGGRAPDVQLAASPMTAASTSAHRRGARAR